MSTEPTRLTEPYNLFEEFDGTRIDPMLTQIFDKMRTYSQLLQEEFIGSAQINEIMNEIDDEWRQLLHKPTRVTGIISFRIPASPGIDTQTIVDFYDDVEMEFGGVLPVHEDSQFIPDADGDDATIYKYTLALRFIRWAKALDGTSVKLEGIASLDDITSIEFPEAMSNERANNWLAYYHPDEQGDIDVALLNPGKEECETLMQLEGISINMNTAHKGDEAQIQRSTRALEMYTNRLIMFDRDAPYLIEVEGYAWDPTGDVGNEKAYVQGKTMASLDRIVWLPTIDDSGQIVPHVSARFLNENKDRPATPMQVPLSVIISLTSCRYDYFFGYNTDDSGK